MEMFKFVKNRFNLFVLVIYILLLLFGLFFIESFKKEKIASYKEEQNSALALSIAQQQQILIREKQETTLAMAIALSQNTLFKDALKSADKEKVNLKKISDDYSISTMYKNVWIQLIDAKGFSFARSWTEKSGDNLYDIREDIRIILKDKKLRSSISVGVFSISFKSMVPIFEGEHFLGAVEIITHFNSLEKKFQEKNIDSIVLVDKKYASRLTESLTKTFIDGYYVANFDANTALIKLIKSDGIENIINSNKLYHIHDKRVVTNNNIYSDTNEIIGHFIASAPSTVLKSRLNEITLLHMLYSLLWILVTSLLLYLLADKNALGRKLKDVNYLRKLIFSFFFFFIIFTSALYLFLEAEKKLKIESFLESNTQKNKSSFTQVYAEHKNLATVIFQTSINTPQVKAILSQSNKDKARAELYETLLPTYSLLSKNNLKQLHFHLPNNRSFLRFHRPLKFGDDLGNSREGVAFVNRNKESIDGFEEGKIYNGFRFVFPLYDESNYLGSVEISFGALAMTEALSKNFGYKTEFLMRKSVVQEKVMDDELFNYVESPLKDFYFEKNTIEHPNYELSRIQLCDKNPKILAQLSARALKGEAFSFYFCDHKNIITFLPLQNPVTKELSAILALSSEHEYVSNKETNSWMTFFVLSFLSGFMLLFMYRELAGKKKINDLNTQLQNAQKIAKMGHWELDLSNNHLFWSDEIFTIFEIDKEHFNPSYEYFLETVHPEDREMVDSAYKNSLLDKKPYSIVHRLLFNDGRVKYVEENCIHVFDEKEKLLISSGTVQDITSRKVTEQNLEYERKCLELIVSASRIGLWEFDMQADTIFWDTHAFAMLGYTDEEFKLSYGVWLEMMHPEDREKTQESLQKQLTNGNSFRLEFRVKHKNGSWFWIDGRGEVIEYDEEIRPKKMVGIHIDANAQKEAEIALTLEKQKAQEANKAKSQFLANMSHEIRTPMNAVIGLGSLLEEMRLGEKERDILHKMNSSSKMLLRILNDILDYSKIEAGKLLLEKKVFALKALSSQIELMFKESAQKKGIIFSIDCDEALPSEVSGDEIRILQVLINLLSNAIKFTSFGTVLLSVKLKKRVDNEHALISFSVSDSGIGISQEQITNLFQAFVQADSSTTRKYGGTGLGLVISQNILHAMQSDISVQSKVGEGTIMAFEILFEVAQWHKQEHSITLNAEINEESLKGMHILVVEDNELNQEVVSMMLESFDIKVDIANNGAEGVEMYFAAQEKYNAILMDLQMPVMGGIEASKKIREQDKEIPIIALTAATMDDDKEKVLEAGMNAHLAKPIEKAELYALLKRHIPQIKKEESEFTVALKEMQAQLSSAAFMEHEYLVNFYEKAEPFVQEEILKEFKEAVEEFEFDRALEILQEFRGS